VLAVVLNERLRLAVWVVLVLSVWGLAATMYGSVDCLPAIVIG
jgi:hypothetical protein